jgi:hypothetical protein
MGCEGLRKNLSNLTLALFLSTNISYQMPKKSSVKRKIRTQSHIYADLSVNHVERVALLQGHSVERVEHDYGYDMVVFTYSPTGEIENGQIYFQLKAKTILEPLKKGNQLAYRVDVRDLNFWLDEPFPVIFVVYDALLEIAYWINVQEYFKDIEIGDVTKVSIRIPRSNVLNRTTMETITAQKAEVLRRIRTLSDQKDR